MKRVLLSWSNTTKRFVKYLRKLAKLKSLGIHFDKQQLLKKRITNLGEKLIILRKHASRTAAIAMTSAGMSLLPHATFSQLNFDNGTEFISPEQGEMWSNISEISDLDGDGDNDLLLIGGYTYEGRDPCKIYKNDGDGNLSYSSNIFLGLNFYEKVIIEDLNGDGKPDLIFGMNEGKIHVLFNDGTGTFSLQPKFLKEGVETAKLVAGDVNGDNSMDIIAIEDIDVNIYLNDKSGNFSFFKGFTNSNGSIKDGALIDFDRDNHLDLVISANAGTHIYKNDGSGNFTDVGPLNSKPEGNLYVADIDNDGYEDLQHAAQGDGYIDGTIYINDGNITPLTNTYENYPLTNVIDIDNDGDLDFPIVRVVNTEMGTFFHSEFRINDGSGGFSTDPTDFSFELNARDGAQERSKIIAVGDVDGDGDIDVLSATESLYNGDYYYYDRGATFFNNNACDNISSITTETTEPTCALNDGEVKVLGLEPDIKNIYKYSTDGGITHTPFDSDASGEFLITDLDEGDFTIQVDSVGCKTNIESATLTNPIAPTLLTTGAHPTCVLNDGTIKISNLEVSVNKKYTYSFDAGTTKVPFDTDRDGEFLITGLDEGSFNLEVDSLGCTSTVLNNTLSNPIPPAILTSVTDPTCIGKDGKISISGLLPNASDEYTYSTDGGAKNTSFSTDKNGEFIFEDLDEGTFNVQVDSAGCTSNIVSSILVNPTSPILVASKIDPTCSLNDGEIYLTGLTPNTSTTYTYKVNGSLTNTSFDTDAKGEFLINGLDEGSFNIQVDSLGCVSNTESIILTNPTSPSINLTLEVDPSACNGNDGKIIVAGLKANTAYSKAYYTDPSSSIQGPISINTDGSGEYEINGLTAGNYTEIYIDSSGCESNRLLTSLNDPLPPTIMSVGENPSTCEGNDGKIIISGLQPSTVYPNTYYTDLNSTIQGPTTRTTNSNGEYEITGLAAGNYTNIYVDSSGCSSNLGTVLLADPQTPVATVLHQQPDCDKDNGEIYILGLTNSYTYDISYTGPAGIVNTSLAPINDSIKLTTLVEGSYSNITVDSNNCTNTYTGPIDFINPTAPTIIAQGIDPMSCEGSDGKISVSGLHSSTIYKNTYYTDADNSLQGPILLSTNIGGEYEISGLVSGSYTDIYVDSLGCISNKVTASLTDPTAPDAPVVVSPTNICEEGALSPLSAVGSNLLWYNDAVGGTGNATVSPSTSKVETVSYYVSQTVANCESPRSKVDVVVYAKPTTPEVTKTISVCLNDQLDLSVNSPDGMFTYNWTNSGEVVNDGETITVTNDATLAYHHLIYDVVASKDGCDSDEASIFVNVEEKTTPTVAISSTDMSPCEGTPIDFEIISSSSLGSAPQYSWNSDLRGELETLELFTNATNFTDGEKISLTISGIDGCVNAVSVSSNELEITLNAIPEVIASVDAEVKCHGGNSGIASVPETKDYSYLWSPSNQTTASATNLGEGDHEVTVTDDQGCKGTATVYIPEPTALVKKDITMTPVSIKDGVDGSATLEIEGGTPDYTYEWDPVPGDPSTIGKSTVAGLQSNTYTVEVRDANDCQLLPSPRIFVEEPFGLNPGAIVANFNGELLEGVNLCNGDQFPPFENKVSVTGGEGDYNYQWEYNEDLTNPDWKAFSATTNTVDFTSSRLISEDFIQIRRKVTDGVGKTAYSGSVNIVKQYPDEISFSIPEEKSELCDDNTNLELIGNGATEDGNNNVFECLTCNDGLTIDGANAQIDATIATAGEHLITYRHTNTYGCVNEVSQNIVINPTPEVSISTVSGGQGVYNSNSTSDTLLVSPAFSIGNGQLSGNGLINDTIFNPQSENIIPDTPEELLYVYTSNKGCVNSAKYTYELTTNKSHISGLNRYFCSKDETVTIEAKNFKNGVTEWVNATMDESESHLATFSPSTFTTGDVIVTFKFLDENNLEAEASFLVTIFETPNFTINETFESDKAFCFDHGPVSLSNGNLFTPFNSTSYYATSEKLTEGNTAYLPSKTPTLGEDRVDYFYTEDYGVTTCSADTFALLTVNDVPVVDFNFTPECQNDELSFTNNSAISEGTISYHWDFGTATSDEVTPTHTYTEAGNYFVELNAESDKGCKANLLKPFTVHPRATPNFELGKTSTGHDIELDNTTELSKGSYSLEWVFSETETSTEDAPAKAYPTEDDYEITLKVTTDQFCTDSITKSITITDLPTPTISIKNYFAPIFGDEPFYLEPSSPSDGDFTYSVPEGACATVDSLSGLVTILCGGPDAIVEVSISQAANNEFSAGMATTTIDINKKDPELIIDYEAFDLVTNDSIITIEFSSDEDVDAFFTQTSGTEVAIIDSTGKIELIGEGLFSVKVTIPATDDYAEFEEVYEFRIYNEPQLPVVVSDTIQLTLYEDTIINILTNDIGITAGLVPELTDIDIINSGDQQSFYDPSIGAFDISETGELSLDLKDVFVGEAVLKYRVVDEEGLWSEYGDVVILVKNPEATPELSYKKLFTPNNDGLNDNFVIGFINSNTPGRLTVLDRIGNVVYQSEEYQNDWNFTLDNEDMVNDGPYFFIYEEEGRDDLQGTFEVRR